MDWQRESERRNRVGKEEEMISTSTRFKIIGAETIGVGAFLLLAFFLNQEGSELGRSLLSIDSDYPIIGSALVLLGLEIFSLLKRLPSTKPRAEDVSNHTKMFSLWTMVSLDMALHGAKVILLEFGASAPALIILGLLVSSRSWLIGGYLILIGINYLPLLVYAIQLSRSSGHLRGEEANIDYRQFGTGQLVILVPLAVVVILAISQFSRRLTR